MKKILVAILLFTYAFAASGASVELHYCMGKLIGWDIDYTSKHECRQCGMRTKPAKGCCDNKQLQAKVDKEQQAVYYNISFLTEQVAIVPLIPNTDEVLSNATIITNPAIHGPPLIDHTPIYLSNCNFRI